MCFAFDRGKLKNKKLRVFDFFSIDLGSLKVESTKEKVTQCCQRDLRFLLTLIRFSVLFTKRMFLFLKWIKESYIKGKKFYVCIAFQHLT